MDLHPSLAVAKFGLGRRPDQPLRADARAWLFAQVEGPGTPNYPPGLPQAADGLAAIVQRRQMQKALKVKLDPSHDPVALLVKADIAAECAQWMTAEDSFRERLVLFWTNHFTTSRRTFECSALIGSFIREAIRPNVNGDFGALLLAVMRHPAMLIYLNNAQSVGPNSPVGLRLHKGLNENLGRECMELHTLSPAAGYTQADVTAMAAILTGWSVKPRAPGAGFLFRANAHEPGPKTLLGRQFPEGEQGGIDALAYLAAHPATARHISTQLARHFVADDPPAPLVEALTARYLETGGNLPAVMRVLIESSASWEPLSKLRTPIDFVCATARAAAVAPDQWEHIPGTLANLGQPVWLAPSPKGWSDLAADWVEPALMLRRVEFAYNVAGQSAGQDPLQLTDIALGPAAPAGLRQAIAGAGSRREAIALLFSSPEFWRR